jgi:hypothetical protein
MMVAKVATGRIMKSFNHSFNLRVRLVFWPHCWFVFILSGLTFSANHSYALSVQSQVKPQVIAQGQSATYNIVVSGTARGRSIGGQLPSVPGLQISNRANTSSSTQIVNGAVTHTLTYGFELRAQSLGAFTIPGWSMEIGGQRLHVPPATFRVVDAKDAFKGVFQLDLELSRDSFYVGEAVDAVLRLLVREGVDVRLAGSPDKIGDGFTQDSVKKDPWTIKQVVRNGIRYQQATAPLVLTPIKDGPQSLKYKLRLAVRSRSRDPIFDFGAFSRMQEKELILESDARTLKVKALPSKGRPVAFSGAVGRFEAVAEARPGQVSVGDPVNLIFRVTGKGRFDRMQAPRLDGGDDFKVYPPKIGFKEGNQSGTGVKTFEYILIPKHADTDQLLEIPFAFFEPERGVYIDLTQRPMAITVIPAPEGTFSPLMPEPVVKSPSSSSKKKTISGGRLLPLRTESGRWVSPGDFRLLQPAYIGTQCMVMALFTGVFFVRRRQLHLAGDPSLRRRIAGDKAVSEWSQKAKDAVAQGNGEAFLDAARRTLQESVGRHMEESEAEALTFDDIHRHLERRSADAATIENARTLFDAVDRLKFGGGDGYTRQGLTELLKSLNQVQEGLK